MLTVVALVLVLSWPENYGDQNGQSEGIGAIFSSIFKASVLCTTNTKILLLGCSQAIFEGGIYTFVFVWVKVLSMLLGGYSAVPTGLIMTSFMLVRCIAYCLVWPL